MAEEAHFKPGTVFGDWRLTAFIGRGGNGEVYCAKHVRQGTSAAVKVLVRKDERAVARFDREAKLMARLKSDSFPHFFAYGEADGYPYLAMELLEPGEPPTSDRTVARFLLKICSAVKELHSHGLVHRDIKPANILYRNATEPVLADFGLIKEVSQSDGQMSAASGNQSISIVDGQRVGAGTIGYGAPEQMERGEATFASDIHAIGVLTDHCFNGRPTGEWARIIQRATSSIPEHRYADVESFMRAIKRRHWLRRTAICLTVASAIGVIGYLRWTPAREHITWQQMAKAVNTNHVDSVVIWRRAPFGLSDEIPLDRDEMHPVARAYFDKNFPTNSTWTTAMPNYIAIDVTNKVNAICINLDKKNITFKEPIRLSSGKEYWITGPGTLDADLSGPQNTIVRLKDCVLLNRTKKLYPENGLHYELQNGVYLNFISIKKQPLDLNLFDFMDHFDGAFNQVRFGGPETVRELLQLNNEESRPTMHLPNREKRLHW